MKRAHAPVILAVIGLSFAVANELSSNEWGGSTAEPLVGVPATGVPLNARVTIHLPLPAGTENELRFLSWNATAIAEVWVVRDGELTPTMPRLLTLGPVLLGSGLTIGEDCPEHIRLHEMILQGAIVNDGTSELQIQLDSGHLFRLEPNQAFYVGSYTTSVEGWPNLNGNPARDGGEADYTIKCVCDCDCGGGVSERYEFACGAACNPPGDQCGQDGMTCTAHDDDGQPVCQSVLSDCHEVIFPVGPGHL